MWPAVEYIQEVVAAKSPLSWVSDEQTGILASTILVLICHLMLEEQITAEWLPNGIHVHNVKDNTAHNEHVLVHVIAFQTPSSHRLKSGVRLS